MSNAIPEIIYGWSQSVVGGDVIGLSYDLERQFLYVTYIGGLFNIFYNVPLSASRTLYYSSHPYNFYKETIEPIYGTLLLADNGIALITNDGKYIAAS